MLTHLYIKNLGIVKELELDFNPHLNIITGETGAGKSILINAFGLALGKNASYSLIRSECLQAEVIAQFDISKLPRVINYLSEHCIPTEENTCVIRRILNNNQSSKAYINGKLASVNQLKELSENLVRVHSQHQQHALIDPNYQREALDKFAKHQNLIDKVKDDYQKFVEISRKIVELNKQKQNADKLDLLQYQIEELDELGLNDGEVIELENKFKIAAKSDELVLKANKCISILDEQENGLLYQLHQLRSNLTGLNLSENSKLVEDAGILLDECLHNLKDYSANLEIDEESLNQMQSRLSKIYDLARKLRTTPENLHNKFNELQEKFDLINNSNHLIEELTKQADKIKHDYIESSTELSSSRMHYAKVLTEIIASRLESLDLPNCKFNIEVKFNHQGSLAAHGLDDVKFLISTNPGQPMDSLKKVSGGELSRISLAVLVAIAKKIDSPMMIFDEVDVGISGKTAELVGNSLVDLSKDTQVLCITHLPQVAAKGTRNFKVSKYQTDNETTSVIEALSFAEKTQELARLMGGTLISDEAIAHAQKLMS
jgi:DNA repair protein RecN (Recombination protein N)